MDDLAFGGSCACGRITYKCSNVPMECAACHCIICRKLSGASFQAFVVIKTSEITCRDTKHSTTSSGLPAKSEHGIDILSLSKFAERAFCADCHTPLGMRYKHSPDVYSMSLGSVDEEAIRDPEVKEALVPNVHIFVCQKVWWLEGIGRDDLRSCERFTGTFEDDIGACEKANP